jgi:Rad3-related DNA helicase
MHRWNKEAGNDRMADAIFRLAQKHHNSKGLIHATYEQAEYLERAIKHMDDPARGNKAKLSERFIFHTPATKATAYQKFRDASPESGTILVGSGMYEGLDLPGDLGRWQAIAKVPWQSLEDPAIAHMTEQDPSWYVWETLKLLIQACGRICRTPDDDGVTYILDTSFDKLYTDGMKFGLVPNWFEDAVDAGRNTE